MAQEIIHVSVEEMSDLRKKAGQTDAKILASSTEYTSTPESGTFANVGTKDFDIPGVGKRTAVGLFTINGEFVSENTISAQKLLAELVAVKSGTRKGRFILKSERVSDLNKYGASADARLVALQGKKFTATPDANTRVYKSEYLDKTDFDKVCQNSDTKASLASALSCTELKKSYIFKIED